VADYSDYEEYEDDIGLDSDAEKKYVKSNRQEWFKGDKGRTYRASFVYFHPFEVAAVLAAKKKNPEITQEQIQKIIDGALAKKAEEASKPVDQLGEHEKLDLKRVRFKRIVAHYKDGFGYVVSRLGKDGPDADRIWAMLDDPRDYFSTCLALYPTTHEGELLRKEVPKGTRVLPWRFSGKLAERVMGMSKSLKNNELTLANQDITMKCTNSEYQNFDIDPAGKALWRQSPKFQAKVLQMACALYPKLNPFREMSTADVRIKLGIGDSDAGESVSDEDFDELIDDV